jgi:endonuclease YncB( thermonuclease family)
MKRARRLLAAILVVFCACFAIGRAQSPAYDVQCVIDGDTVALETIGTVRLIGVGTPETVDPRRPVERFGRESATFLRSMLEGQSVRLEYDQQRIDKYGRTLVYLYMPDGTFVNLEIVRRGYESAPLAWGSNRTAIVRVILGCAPEA